MGDVAQTGASAGRDRLVRSAYDLLRDDLLAGRFEPGMRLRVEELSSRYEIGASPLREALSRLSESGLIVSEPQRGYRVASVSREEYRDLVAVRLRLETQALAESIENGDIDWEAEVVGAYHRLTRAHDSLNKGGEEAFSVWAQADRAFHRATIVNCGSPWLLRFCEMIYDQTSRYHRQKLLRGVAPVDKTRNEHKRLMEAVIARDVERACVCLKNHIQNVAVRVEHDAFGNDK